MTEQLKTLMDKAADLDFAVVDVDAITGAGDRTVRRRRIATGVAGVAALAVVATGAVLLSGDGDDRADVVDDPTFRSDVPMWAEGSVLHTPSGTFELGVDVVSVTRSATGIVFVGEGGGVYLFDGKDPQRIGTSGGDYPYLVGDSDGTKVGWVGESGGDLEYVVRDLATGATSQYPAEVATGDGQGAPIGALFLAIEGDSAHWYDAGGGTTVDLETGEMSTSPVREGRFVIDAEAGRTVVFVESPSGEDLGSEVVDSDGRVLLDRRVVGTVAVLSPDGKWVTSAEDLSVWDVDTGRQLVFASLAGRDGAGIDWLDADTLVVVAEREDDHDRLEILTCEVPRGTCVAAGEPDFEEGQTFALPGSGLLFGIGTGGGEASGSDSSSVEVEVEASEVPATSSTDRPE